MPSGSLPPVSSTDRRSNGRRIGPCPQCGGHRWWDNRAAKRAGQASADGPDLRCVACRHGIWERDDPDGGWEPQATTVLPTAGPDAMRTAAPRACRGTTKAGTPCRAGARRGSDYCPAHADQRP